MLPVSGDQLNKRWSGQKVADKRGRKGGRKRGTGVHNGREGVGTQGRHNASLMMRESEGDEAVHT